MSNNKVTAKDLQLGRNYIGIATVKGTDDVYGPYDSDSNYVVSLELYTEYPNYGNSIEMVKVTYWDHIDGACVYKFPTYTTFVKSKHYSEKESEYK